MNNKNGSLFFTDDLQELAVLLAFTQEKIIDRQNTFNNRRLYSISGNAANHTDLIERVFSRKEKILISPADLFDIYAQLVREVKRK